LPGTSGFVGEFLVLLGTFKTDPAVATFAASGIVLGATYMLLLYRKIVFGTPASPEVTAMPDLNNRESFYFLPLVLLVIWLGISPAYVMDRIGPSAEKLVADYQADLSGPNLPVSQQAQINPEISR
jgi:NADH-quinone oxidoreductase subunit M